MSQAAPPRERSSLPPELRLSVPDWCFYDDKTDPVRYYQELRSLGIAGVEMVAPSRFSAARAAGLSILNQSGPGMTRGLNRIAHHAELLPAIRALINSAAAADIPQVIVFSGNRDGQDDAEGKANVIVGLKALAADAERAKVTLVFEMLCAQNHPDYQADHSAYGFDVVEAVASPAVKVLYDIYHMSRMGEDVIGDIVGHPELIAHLHTAESPARSAPRRDGEINYGAVVQAGLAAGYVGYWGLEFVPQADRASELRAAIATFR
jgi:hydroxypyruvate isomerase